MQKTIAGASKECLHTNNIIQFLLVHIIFDSVHLIVHLDSEERKRDISNALAISIVLFEH